MSKSTVLHAIILFFLSVTSLAETYYVRQDSSGDFTSIADAIVVAARYDYIIVGDGTWTGVDNTDLSFNGKAVRLVSENGAENCVIDCDDDVRAFILDESESDELVIKGFTITNGGGLYGGALYIEGTSPAIRDCVFVGNGQNSFEGGAVYCFNSAASFKRCTFIDNSSSLGAAVSCENDVIFRECCFYDNLATYEGGALYVSSGQYDEDHDFIIDCVFENNVSLEEGGAIYGSLYNSLVVNSIFENNYAAVGGAVYFPQGVNCCFSDCEFSQNYARSGGCFYTGSTDIDLTNCIFDRNFALKRGGAIYVSNSDINITNCLFDRNIASVTGAAIAGIDETYDCTSQITNCTFVNNTAPSEGAAVDSRDLEYDYYTNCIISDNSYPAFDSSYIYSNTSYCCLPGDWEGILDGPLSIDYFDDTNIFADPLFVTGPSGDYYLSSIDTDNDQSSPCVDSGLGQAFDSEICGYTTRTDGVIDLNTVDMGYHYPTQAADINADGTVNLLDFNTLVTQYNTDNIELPDSPKLAYWPLDEGYGNEYVFDYSGSEITGYMQNMDEYYSWQYGLFGTALYFDGTDDYIHVPHFLNPADGPFTVSVWVYGGSTGAIIQQLDGTGTGRKWLAVSGPPADSQLGTIKTFLTQNESLGSLDGEFSFAPNRWHHLVFVWDGSKRHLYANSRLIARDSSALADGLEFCDGDCLIGSGQTVSSAAMFNGIMDEICVYSQALSYEEISNLYAEGMYYEQGHWKFDEGSGSVVYSSGDDSLVGILHNMSPSSWTTDGKYGSALSFDGYDDYVSVPFIVNPYDCSLSAFAWVKSPTERSLFTVRRIISQADSDNGSCSWLTQNAYGYLSTFLYQNSDNSFFTSSFKIADDTWHHVGVIVDHQYITLYADGSVVAQAVHEGAIAASTGQMLIGTNPGASDKFWLGQIDDVRVYSFPLSSRQIEQIRKGGTVMYLEHICEDRPEADINQDCKVDLDDLLHMAARWLQ